MNQEMERGVVNSWTGEQGLTSACAEGDSRLSRGLKCQAAYDAGKVTFRGRLEDGSGKRRGHSPSASSVLSDCSEEGLEAEQSGGNFRSTVASYQSGRALRIFPS
jgi:hypothetical protein